MEKSSEPTSYKIKDPVKNHSHPRLKSGEIIIVITDCIFPGFRLQYRYEDIKGCLKEYLEQGGNIMAEQKPKVLTGHCNGCANRCPINSMQCARGLMIMGFGTLDKQKKKKSEEGLGTLLRACSNKLFVGKAGEEFFDTLTAEEKANLRDYLTRLSGQ